MRVRKFKDISCPCCGHKGIVGVVTVKEIKDVPYEELEPYCSECNSYFVDHTVLDQSIENKRKAMRKAYGLVSLEDILKLPKMYGVSRELLEIILDLHTGGFGCTIWEGEIPTSDESDAIKQALVDPKFFLNRLEAVKNRIPKEKYIKLHKRAASMKCRG